MTNIKDEFISTLSHEIRTPLTSIKGFSQTMLSNWEKLDDDKKKEFVNIILNQSQRLINLVENVLNVAKIDSNSEKIVSTKINVNQILKNCINLVSISHKDFVFDFCQSKNELFSLADSDKTQQILLNILDNAVKYSQNSNHIEIKTYNKNDYNVFAIKNFGATISEKDKEKIFEKFYRIDSYLTSTRQGSGLGLYIAQNLAKKMGGFIEVESKENFVEFLLYLPTFEIEKITKKIIS